MKQIIITFKDPIVVNGSSSKVIRVDRVFIDNFTGPVVIQAVINDQYLIFPVHNVLGTSLVDKEIV